MSTPHGRTPGDAVVRGILLRLLYGDQYMETERNPSMDVEANKATVTAFDPGGSRPRYRLRSAAQRLVDVATFRFSSENSTLLNAREDGSIPLNTAVS